jgi:hypothetical protein
MSTTTVQSAELNCLEVYNKDFKTKTTQLWLLIDANIKESLCQPQPTKKENLM